LYLTGPKKNGVCGVGEAEFDRGASRVSIGQREAKNKQEKGEEGERDKAAKK
jgi:hypothetical protein